MEINSKGKIKTFFILGTLIINSSITWAGISILDFCGRYNMVINGSKGILQLISSTDKKNYTLKGTYRDIETNETYEVEGYTGEKILEHKIIFFINFKKSRQMFEGYLMDKTKDALAGYTVIGDMPVGFYATKQIEYQPIKEKTKIRESIIQKSINDKIADLRFILKDIRTTILVYNGQHHPKAKLGFIWDKETKNQIITPDVTAQLSQRTDKYGFTKTQGGNEQNLNYGPYFYEFPINPFTSGNTIHLVNSPLPIEKIITSPKDYDWIYNLQTCEFRAGGQEILPPNIQERREDNTLFNF